MNVIGSGTIACYENNFVILKKMNSFKNCLKTYTQSESNLSKFTGSVQTFKPHNLLIQSGLLSKKTKVKKYPQLECLDILHQGK